MPFFQKFQRVLFLFLRGPHPHFKIFNRILINNIQDERSRFSPRRYIPIHSKNQNKFLQWTYHMQQLNQNSSKGFKDLNRSSGKRVAHSLQEANSMEDLEDMETIFSSYEDERGLGGTSWEFEELNSSITESL